MEWQARKGEVRIGGGLNGKDRIGRRGRERSGKDWKGAVCRGLAGEERRGGDRFGMDWQAGRGLDWIGWYGNG